MGIQDIESARCNRGHGADLLQGTESESCLLIPHKLASLFLCRGWAPSARSSLHLCTVAWAHCCALLLSLSLSLSRSVSTKGFPRPASIVVPIHFPPLHPLLCFIRVRDNNSTCTIYQIPSSTGSCIAHHPPPGPCAINPSQASSSPSASIVYAFHRCHHQIVATAFGCRLYPGPSSHREPPCSSTRQKTSLPCPALPCPARLVRLEAAKGPFGARLQPQQGGSSGGRRGSVGVRLLQAADDSSAVCVSAGAVLHR